MKKIAIIALTVSALTGCATMPSAQYVPANTYQAYDCPVLATEYNRVNQFINANQHHSGVILSGVGIGLGVGRGGFYPSISLGVGQANSIDRQSVANALGQRDAIIQSGRVKQCPFVNGLKLSNEK